MDTPDGRFTPITALDAAWQVPGQSARLRAVRVAAEGLRERIVSGPRVIAVRTLPLATQVYSTADAFSGLLSTRLPIVLRRHAVLVQFLVQGQLKTLLFNPSDPTALERAPLFQRQTLPATLAQRAAAQRFEPMEAQLSALGVTLQEVDYVAFNHLELEDVGAVLGRSPGARLLTPASEWEDRADVHPAARAWYVPEERGVPEERVQLTRGDIILGDGVYLVRTPGRTRGHQTLILSTPRGVWAVSANGVAVDSWSPLDSQIRGLAAACRRRGLPSAPSSGALSCGAEQHASMVLERALVGRAAHAPAFVQVLPASELWASAVSPWIRPTVSYGGIDCGRLAH